MYLNCACRFSPYYHNHQWSLEKRLTIHALSFKNVITWCFFLCHKRVHGSFCSESKVVGLKGRPQGHWTDNERCCVPLCLHLMFHQMRIFKDLLLIYFRRVEGSWICLEWWEKWWEMWWVAVSANFKSTEAIVLMNESRIWPGLHPPFYLNFLFFFS